MHHRHRTEWIVLTVVAMTVTLGLAETVESEFTPPTGLPDGWYARIETSKGRIIARLLPEQAPQSVAHFSALADGRLEWFDRVSGRLEKGPYYDGIKVHKVIAGLRFEAGDRQGTGRGAPALHVPPEGKGPVNFHRAGRLGMTAIDGASSAVQFFATAVGQPWLSGRHPCFGIIVSGLQVVTEISQAKSYSNQRPIDPPVIDRIRIFAVGDPAPLPEPHPYMPGRKGVQLRPAPGEAKGP